MNKIRFFLFVFFCLCIGINNRIIHSQYSTNNKYCRKSENPSLWETFENAVDSLNVMLYNIGEAIDSFNGDYSSYSDRIKAKKEKKDEFIQNSPSAYLYEIALRLNVNCFLYDNRIDMIDDGTTKETPYNIRPIK